MPERGRFRKLVQCGLDQLNLDELLRDMPRPSWPKMRDRCTLKARGAVDSRPAVASFRKRPGHRELASRGDASWSGPSRGRGKQAEGAGLLNGFVAPVRAEFVVDVAHVDLDSVHRQVDLVFVERVIRSTVLVRDHAGPKKMHL